MKMPSLTDENDCDLSEARRLQKVKGRVQTPGRLVTHCLVQLRDYLGQLVPGVNKRIQRNLVLIKGVQNKLNYTFNNNNKTQMVSLLLVFDLFQS